MAIGTPAILKDNGAVTTNGQTTVAVSGVVIPANTRVVVLVACSNVNTSVADPSQISDGTNNYTKHDTATGEPSTPFVHESEWSFYDSGGGTKTITVTLGSSCNYTHVVVIGISSAGSAAGDVDEIGGGDQGGTTTVAIISTATVDQSDEASVIGLNWGTSTALSKWAPTNYTSLFNTTNATRARGHAGARRTPLTSGAAETGSNEVILGGATRWAGTLTTFKGASSGVSVTGVGAIASLEAFGTTQIIRILQQVAIGSAEAFGTTLTKRLIQNAGAIATAEALGQPKILRLVQPIPGIASVEQFGQAKLIRIVGPTGIVTAVAIGTAQALRRIGPTGIASLEAFGTTHLLRIVGPLGIASLEAFGRPTIIGGIQGPYTVTGVGAIGSLEAFGVTHVLRLIGPTGITSAAVFGTTQARRNIGPTGIASTQALGAPALRRILAAAGVTSGESFGTTRVLRVIGVVNISTGETFGTVQVAPAAPSTARGFAEATVSDGPRHEVIVSDGQTYVVTVTDLILTEATTADQRRYLSQISDLALTDIATGERPAS